MVQQMADIAGNTIHICSESFIHY